MPVFEVLFAMVVVWFGLVKWLCSMLETRHAAIYESMGRPGLLAGNNPFTVLALLKFIAVRGHRDLRDESLGRLSDFMLIFFSVYVALLVWLVFNMPKAVA